MFECKKCKCAILGIMDVEFEGGWAYCKTCFETLKENHVKKEEREGPEVIEQKTLL